MSINKLVNAGFVQRAEHARLNLGHSRYFISFYAMQPKMIYLFTVDLKTRVLT